MAVYNLTYSIAPGEMKLFLPSNFDGSQSDYYVLSSGTPPMNVFVRFGVAGSGFAYGFVSGGQIGEFSFTVDQYVYGTLINTYNVELTVSSNQLITDCCNTDKTLVWLNRAGGISSYSFSEKVNLTLDQKSGGQIKTSSFELQHISKEDVYEGVVISQSGIPIDHDRIIKSLRTCIQAWEQQGVKLVPIILSVDSFVYRPREQGTFEVGFDYRYSNEIIIQTH